MKRSIAALAAVTLLATPALAKGMHGGRGHEAQQQNSEAKKQAEQKLTKDYNAALETIPNQSYDPWGGVREAPKTK
jgi:hypothetical protein